MSFDSTDTRPIASTHEAWTQVLDAVTDLIVVHDADGRVVHANRAFAGRAGLGVEEMRGRPYWDVFPGMTGPLPIGPESAHPDRGPTPAQVRLETGEVYSSIVLPACDRDGADPYTVRVLTPVSGPGAAAGRDVMDRSAPCDIGERQRLERELRNANRAMRVLSGSNRSLIYARNAEKLFHDICRLIVDPGGYRLAWIGFAENDEARSIRPVAQFGYEAGYLENARISWGDNDRGRGPSGTAIRSGEIQVNQDFQTNPRMAPWRADAAKRGYASSIALPLKGESGTFGVLSIYACEPDAFDPSEVQLLEELAYDLAFGIASLRLRAEHEAAEREIRRLNESLERRVRERTAELEAVNEELQAFSYSVSHDLRAPLRALDGFSKLVLDECADGISAPGREYLRRIRANSQYMGQLIDSLLRLSHVSLQESRRVAVDLSAIADGIRRDLQAEDTVRSVAWNIAPDIVVQADPDLMRVALDNLLRNAWKYTAERAEARIEFGRETVEGEEVYFVSDNGAGFDMAYANRLFKPFQRLHGRARFEGSGVGLAIVWRVIRKHGGRLWATGIPDRGASFRFTLRDATAQSSESVSTSG